MMTHHVLDALESLARRTTARDEDKPWGNWTAEELKLHNKVLRAFPSSPRQKELKRRLEELRAKNPAVRKANAGTSDVKRQWFEANTPYGPGDLIKLPNGKIAEVTKCLLGENLFHEPEYHVSTKTGECVVVPVKTRAKDKGPCLTCGKPTPGDEHFCSAMCEEKWLAKTYPRDWADMKRRGGKLEDSPRKAPARLHRALDAVLDSARARDFDPAQAIKIAADDITKLRKQDVYRVLEQNGASHMSSIADYIIAKRPDLAYEVHDCVADLR